MLPQKCKERGCKRFMVGTQKENFVDCCIIERTKKGIGVMPVFRISEKECRILRSAMTAAAAHDQTDQIPTRE